MFIKFITLFSILVSSVVLHAKQSDEIKVTFDVLYWGEWPEHNLRYLSMGKEKLLPLRTSSTGNFFTYQGPPTVVFYRESTTDAKTGVASPIPLASVTFPDSKGHYILMFRNKSDVKTEYGIYPLPLDPSSFPVDTVLALNFSKFPAELQIGGQKSTLPPEGNKLFAVQSGECDIQLATLENEKWRLIYSGSHHMPEKQRILMVVHKTEQGTAGVVTFTIINSASDKETVVDPNYIPETKPGS